MQKLLFMGILSILFVGCSTSPVNSNQTAMVPESRMVDSDYFIRKSYFTFFTLLRYSAI